MKIEFGVEKESILRQETLRCRIAIRNEEPGAIRIPDPLVRPDALAIRVLDLRTGRERIHRTVVPPPRSPRLREVPSGQALSWDFLLSEKVPNLASGEFELSAIHEPAESKAVKVRVLPSTPSRVVLDAGEDIVHAACILAPGGDLVRARLNLMDRVVDETLRVAQAGLRSRPRLSVVPPASESRHHWIAWTSEGSLACAGVSPELGASEIRTFPDVLDLVGGLTCDPIGVTTRRPRWSALVRSAKGLQVLEDSGARGPVVEWSKSPSWSSSHVRKDRSRFALMMDGGNLMMTDWSEFGLSEPRKVGQGRAIATDAIQDFDDSVQGAWLLEDGEIVVWRMSPDGRFGSSSKGRVRLRGEEETRLRVSRGGRVALLRGERLFLDGQPAILPIPAVDVVFRRSGRAFVVAAGDGLSLHPAEEA